MFLIVFLRCSLRSHKVKESLGNLKEIFVKNILI